jgi:simple sugar transport system permease protein/ribose transport system permease protein
MKERVVTRRAVEAEAAEEAAARAASPWRVPIIVGSAVLALLLIGWVTTPRFVTVDNALIIVRSASIIGIVAVALTFVTISGNFFSLSLGETASFSAIAFSFMIAEGWGVPVALVLTLVLALAFGAVQGAVVAAGANPIITTLGAGAALFGLAAVLTDNKTMRTGSNVADWVGRGRPFGIPNQTWAFVILTIVAALVLTKTPFGRRLALVGSNAAAATATGLRRGTIAIAAFAIASLGAGLAGMFTAAQVGQGTTDQFPELTINAIAAVLVGGTVISGGEGSMLRTALGAVFIAGLDNLLVIRGYSFGVRVTVTGLAVLAGVSLFTVLRRRTV